MGHCVLLIASLGVVLSISSFFSSATKTHDIWLTKADRAERHPDFWQAYEFKLTKAGKMEKDVNIESIIKTDLNNDYMCEVKILQKSGGNYIKAPIEVPKQPCCDFIENNTFLWPCIRQNSNFPEKCPINKGPFWIKSFNPNDCNYTENLPPKLPEDYKVEMHISLGPEQIFKQNYYGKLKSIMRLL